MCQVLHAVKSLIELNGAAHGIKHEVSVQISPGLGLAFEIHLYVINLHFGRTPAHCSVWVCPTLSVAVLGLPQPEFAGTSYGILQTAQEETAGRTPTICIFCRSRGQYMTLWTILIELVTVDFDPIRCLKCTQQKQGCPPVSANNFG